MFKTIFAVCAFVALCAPVYAGEWTATNSNGGSGSGSTTCEPGGSGSLHCTGHGTWVDANGVVREHSARREISRETVTGTNTVTRNGRERVYSWNRTRRNK